MGADRRINERQEQVIESDRKALEKIMSRVLYIGGAFFCVTAVLIIGVSYWITSSRSMETVWKMFCASGGLILALYVFERLGLFTWPWRKKEISNGDSNGNNHVDSSNISQGT